MNNLVSIITPSFNSGRFIKDCVTSVLNQTYSNFEMIIVDDFSSDDSKQKIRILAENDSRINVFFLNQNIGAAEARNIALSKAKGKYIAFLDADDLWDSKKLEKQISFMKKYDIAFSYTSYQAISEDGVTNLYNVIAQKKMDYNSYLMNSIIGCLTVILDREKIGYIKMSDLRSSHDMALWLSIMKRGFSAYGLVENLAKYRVVNSSNTANKIKAAIEVWRLYKEIEKLNFFYRVWCFMCYAVNAIKKRIW